MENTTMSHITLIAAIIGNYFQEKISLHTGADHLTTLKICGDLSVTVYRALEHELISYGDVTYLDNVINKTKDVLNTDYKIRLFP